MNSEVKNILLFGAYYENKGASLLIETVKDFHSGDRLAIPVGLSWNVYKENKKRNIYTIIFLRYGRFNLFDLFHFLPRRLLLRFGIMRLRDVSFMYDISGFAYGGHWSQNIVKFAQALFSYGPKELKILPQAFGKFDEQNKDNAAKYFNGATDIYVRDKVSYDNLKSLELKVSPKLLSDITFALQVGSEEKEYDLLIVPNYKLIDRGVYNIEEWCQQLEQLIVTNEDFSRISFLIHEGKKDVWMAQEFNRLCSRDIPIIECATGLDCKVFISRSRVVLSARYHGVISALSCGVSTYSYSWSHKYEEVMDEFGLSNNLFHPKRKDLKLDANKLPSSTRRREIKYRINNEIKWFQ